MVLSERSVTAVLGRLWGGLVAGRAVQSITLLPNTLATDQNHTKHVLDLKARTLKSIFQCSMNSSKRRSWAP
jgi:hypothetical protein